MSDGWFEKAGSFLRKFVGYTIAFVVGGFLLIAIGSAISPESSVTGMKDPTGAGLVLMMAGVLSLFGSPIFSWLLLSRQERQKRMARQHQDAKVASELAEKEALRRRFFERERLIDCVDEHRVALVRNLSRAVRKNDYGAVVEDNRPKAMLEFLASIDLDVDVIDYSEAVEVVSEQLAEYDEQARAKGFDAESLPFDGYAFEHWVASALIGFGWEAEVTAASGDQGIDVLASRGGKRLGLQCKLYSSAIGNKAIQEAYAGKAFHGLDQVGVLSNAEFTSSARALASTTGVLLLSHHDIPKLHEKVFPDR